MLLIPAHIMIALLFCGWMGGMYLRLVAKELNRRERYLKHRLEEKIAEAEARMIPPAEEKLDAEPIVAEAVEPIETAAAA